MLKISIKYSKQPFEKIKTRQRETETQRKRQKESKRDKETKRDRDKYKRHKK